MDEVIYVRLSDDLNRRLEAILKQSPTKKSTLARFLLEKAVEEYERRQREGRQDWFPAQVEAVPA